MDSQVIAAALATERKCYAALTEVMELTQDLSDAVQRQDQVTVQMFLSMRQEPINQLKEYRSLQRKRCASLPEEESAALWKVLTGKGGRRHRPASGSGEGGGTKPKSAGANPAGGPSGQRQSGREEVLLQQVDRTREKGRLCQRKFPCRRARRQGNRAL